ncbi:MAG: hypothetical protein EPN82_03875 [Bacteroidetes bacterium]|nr:MAG: hypothetical protein EPN82_03875 [Bacteroidota bacterium]
MTSILVKPKTKDELFLVYELLNKMQVDFYKIEPDDNIESDFDKERDEWLRFSMINFSKTYGEDEPDYENAVIKEPNPDYDPH